MNKILSNDYIIFATRIILGFVFVAASIDKVSDPTAFAVSIGYYKLVGSSASLLLATILPWMELLCGLFLIFGVMLRGSSLLALLLLLVFTCGVISGMARGLDISCGCFTRDPGVDKIGWMKVAENVGLILLSLATFFSRNDRFSLASCNTQSISPTPDETKDSLA